MIRQCDLNRRRGVDVDVSSDFSVFRYLLLVPFVPYRSLRSDEAQPKELSQVGGIEGGLDHGGQDVVDAAVGSDLAGEHKDDGVAVVLDEIFHSFEFLAW